MKYEYYDAVSKELLNQKTADIDEITINNAVLTIKEVETGFWFLQRNKKIHSVYITSNYGYINGIRNNNGDELKIEFTVYALSYPAGYENKIVCNLDISELFNTI